MSILLSHSEKLPYFYQVAQSGSILKASIVLGIAQPALSQSMKILENAIGATLFTRSRSGVELTTQGKILYEYYTEIKDKTDDIEKRMFSDTNIQDEFIELKIGTHEGLVNSVWPKLVQGIKKRGLKIKLSLYTEFSTLGLSEKLLNGNLDAVISVDRNRFKFPSIKYQPIIKDYYNFYVGKDYLPQKRIIKRSELDSIPFIFMPNTIAGYNLTLQDILDANDLNIKPAQSLTTFESVKSIVQNGLGVGIIPNQICSYELKNKFVRPIKIEGVDTQTFGPHSFSFCYRNTKKDSHRLREFSKLVSESFD
jgi:DNA-binding transcriptional LysR family regulator